VAMEMNLAETAFFYPEGDGYRLRWFTPTVEVELCGHATLASAHVLYETGRLGPSDEARFDTASGRLTVRAEPIPGEGGMRLVMDFPATPPTEVPAPEGLAEALGVEPVWTGQSRGNIVAELPDDATVRALAPDLHALGALDTAGVVVTARADEGRGYDFVSRYFAPALGVPEDPVTGSAHCKLAPYWAAKLGRDALTGYQASARGGLVGLRVRGDRVDLIGQAVTVFEGKLLV